MKRSICSHKPGSLWNRVLINATVFFCLFAGIPDARLVADPAPQIDREANDDPIKEIRLLKDEMRPNRRTSLTFYTRLMDRRESHRRDTCRELVQIFKDQTAANGARACAANCLGELQMQDAVNDLAPQVGFLFTQPLYVYHLNDMPEFEQFPVQQALIKIGIASVPALIGNLVQSDDAQVRKLSLEAIYRIEGDKDIVQIRLQKAAKAETDAKKQARLQAALKALDEAKF